MIEKGLSENGYTLAPCPLPGTIRMRWMTDQLKSALAVGPADPGTIRMRWMTDQPKSALAVGPADPGTIRMRRTTAQPKSALHAGESRLFLPLGNNLIAIWPGG